MKGMEGGGGGERETQWPDPDFYPFRIPDPGVKKAPDPGAVLGIRNRFFPDPR